MKTIDGAFRESVRKFGERTALRYYHEEQWVQISYGELDSAVCIIAHGLVELGVKKGDKVAIMSENRPEWIVCYLAIITVGAVAVPIDAQLGEIETEHIINHSAAGCIICSMKCYEVISRIIAGLTNLSDVVIFDRNVIVRRDHLGEGKGKEVAKNGRKNNHHKNFWAYDEIRDRGSASLSKSAAVFPEKEVGELASIIYTSGTTGSPKGVMLTHRNFMSNVVAIRNIITLDETDNMLLLLPLHHAFPFTVCLVLPLAAGSTISFVDILSKDRTRLIMECAPTLMVGVPLLYSKIYRGIIRQIETSKVKNMLFKYGGKKIIGRALKKKLGGKLRLMVSGAAPMDPAVIEGFRALGIEFLEGYGLTETSPVASCNRPGNIKIGSVGPPIGGVEVKIVQPGDDGIGELAIRGENVMQGYFNNPAQTKKVIRDGWFHTGDLAYIDGDGFIFITGRAKDVIVNRGGKNVYPDVVENVVNQSRYIAESIVLGYKTKGMVGEDVGVLVYPDYEALMGYAEGKGMAFDEEIDLNELTEDAKNELIEKFQPMLEQEVRQSMSKLASYQRVNRIAIERDEFVKTSTRKIKRFLYKGRLDILDI